MAPPSRTTYTIGTRKSELALVQTHYVMAELKRHHPGLELLELGMTTTGDNILNSPLSQIGSKSLFTKELEVALLDGRSDLVVHSLKDLPTTLPADLQLGAVLEREDPVDSVVLRHPPPLSAMGMVPMTLDDLPKGSVIGTSSVRRIAQLRRCFPHLEFADVRGNLNTRLAKLDAHDSPYSAIILAKAGLMRLGWSDRISFSLSMDVSLHAVGQGALAIECREGDEDILSLIAPLEHTPTRLRVEAERALMRSLEGGCSVPIGVATRWLGGRHHLEIEGSVTSPDGERRAYGKVDGAVKDNAEAASLGCLLAKALRDQGAQEILDAITKGK